MRWEGGGERCWKIQRTCGSKTGTRHERQSGIAGEALFFSARETFRAALACANSSGGAVQERLAESDQSGRSGIWGDGQAIRIHLLTGAAWVSSHFRFQGQIGPMTLSPWATTRRVRWGGGKRNPL